MIQKAHGKFVFNREALMDYGAKVKLLPYRLGYGLRIGVGGAIQSGLRKEDVPECQCSCVLCSDRCDLCITDELFGK